MSRIEEHLANLIKSRDRIETNLESLREGLDGQLEKKRLYEEGLADENTTYDVDALKQGLASIDTAIESIEDVIKKDEDKLQVLYNKIDGIRALMQTDDVAEEFDEVIEDDGKD